MLLDLTTTIGHFLQIVLGDAAAVWNCYKLPRLLATELHKRTVHQLKASICLLPLFPEIFHPAKRTQNKAERHLTEAEC